MRCEIIEALFEVTQTLANEQKTARDYGTGQLLYHSEINLLEAICEHPNKNAIGLSQVMGVTRGAITQTGNKLEEKGLVKRVSDSKNKKEKYYRLTEAGEQAWRGHQQHHAQANRKMCQYLSSLSSEKKQVLLTFFDTIKECMPISLFDCMGDC